MDAILPPAADPAADRPYRELDTLALCSLGEAFELQLDQEDNRETPAALSLLSGLVHLDRELWLRRMGADYL